tara:strand:+ start:1688 stop:2014 length:327 start_codon:yes stop_codon:yes gene_type:complete
MGAAESAPVEVDDATAAQPDAVEQKASYFFAFNSKTTVTTVEPGPAVAPAPPPRSIRSQSTVDPRDDTAWVPCADGGFVRQRIDDLNQAEVRRVSVETEDAKLASGAR